MAVRSHAVVVNLVQGLSEVNFFHFSGFFSLFLCVVFVQSLTGDREVDDREYELKQLLEGERFTPLFKVRVCVQE